MRLRVTSVGWRLVVQPRAGSPPRLTDLQPPIYSSTQQHPAAHRTHDTLLLYLVRQHVRP